MQCQLPRPHLLYVDHKTSDDHIYLQSAAKRFGVHVSRPGNGICHTVHVARFGAPGKISMGGDSHTPHGGSIGMLCIGVGGMDVATAMTGVPMRLKMPRVIQVKLTGRLKPGVNAKEVILKMLEKVTIKGGLGNVNRILQKSTQRGCLLFVWIFLQSFCFIEQNEAFSTTKQNEINF